MADSADPSKPMQFADLVAFDGSIKDLNDAGITAENVLILDAAQAAIDDTYTSVRGIAPAWHKAKEMVFADLKSQNKPLELDFAELLIRELEAHYGEDKQAPEQEATPCKEKKKPEPPAKSPKAKARVEVKISIITMRGCACLTLRLVQKIMSLAVCVSFFHLSSNWHMCETC